MNRRLLEDPSHPTSLSHHPDFIKLWVGQTISIAGMKVTGLAVPLTAVLALHATPIQMSLMNVAWNSSAVLTGLFAGVLVDRLPRRPVLIGMDLGRMALVASIPITAYFGLLRMEQMYLAAFLVGVLSVFFDIAYLSFLPTLVQRPHLVEANSKLEMSRSVLNVAGPGLAGALVQLLTAPLALTLDAFSYLVSALSLMTIGAPEPSTTPHAQRQSIWREIGEGLRTVWDLPVLRTLAATSATFLFFLGINGTVYMLYLVDTLDIAPALLGVIFTVGSLGGLLGAMVAGRTARRLGLRSTLVGGQLLSGVGGLSLALTSGPMAIVACIVTTGTVLSGLGGTLYNINALSLRQAVTPDALQGRVNATLRVLSWGMGAVGAFAGGVLGSHFGLRPTVFVAGIGQLLAFLWLLRAPLPVLPESETPAEAS